MKRLVLLADDFASDSQCPLHQVWGTTMVVNGVEVVQCPGVGAPHYFTWAPA